MVTITRIQCDRCGLISKESEATGWMVEQDYCLSQMVHYCPNCTEDYIAARESLESEITTLQEQFNLVWRRHGT